MAKGLKNWFEIFKAGTHFSSNGRKRTWTNEDLDKIVEATNFSVPLVVGHVKVNYPVYGGAEIKTEDGRELKFNVHNIPHKFCDIGTFLAYLQTGRDIANGEYNFNDEKISEYRSLVDADTNIVYMKDAKKDFLSLKQNYEKKGQEVEAKGNILIFKS